MGLGELFLLAVGLAMDAFAVAVCKGLSIQKLKLRHALLVGLWFGVFQALMPAVGYLLGSAFAGLVQAVDHWVAFILLGIIGGNMIREGVKGDAEDCDPSLAFGTMLMLAVATSIDALAVGITFAFLNVPILAAWLSSGWSPSLSLPWASRLVTYLGPATNRKRKFSAAQSSSSLVQKSCWSTWSCCPFEAVQIPWQRETPGPSGPGDRFPWFGTWEEGDYGCS